MAVTYLRLFDPTQQFQLKNGAINVAGLLKVKLEGTDDWAPVFDENGTQLQQPVILDNNGRSKGLFVDASKVYWLEVDDRDGYELFTIRKMTPCGGGTGSSLGATYDVQSTDGTVNVTRYDNGGTVTFDLSIATQSEESKWGATFGTVASVTGDGTWEQVPAWTSAGSVAWNNGWEATKDCVADIAASLEMTSGDADALYWLDVRCDFSIDGTVVSTEYGMLDPSENTGRVTFEYKGALTEGQKIDCRFSVKSVEAMTPVLVGRAYYNEECDGIVGGENQGTTYIPGDYVEITTADVINVTGLQPLSGMSSYAYQSSLDNCCSSMSSVVSSIQNDVSSISSYVSSLTGITGDFVEKSSISAESAKWNEVSGKIPWSALSGDGTKITGISGSAIGGSYYSAGTYIDISGNVISVTGLQPSGDYAYNSAVSSKVDQSAFDDCCSSMSGAVSSLSSIVSSISGNTGNYVEKSSISAQSGIWNEASGMSGKLDNSASSNFYPMTGNPSGFITGVDLTGYVEKSAISAESSVWNSASAVSSMIPWSALEDDGSHITAISGSAIGGGGTGGKVYAGISPVVVNNTADTISLDYSGLTTDETLTAYTSGSDIVLGVNASALDLTSYQKISGMSAYQTVEDMSAFVPFSAVSADENSAITSINGSAVGVGTGYVPVSAISAQSSVWNSASSVSAMLPKSAIQGSAGQVTVIDGSSIYAGDGPFVYRSSVAASIGSAGAAVTTSLAQGVSAKAYIGSFAQGYRVSASSDSFSQGTGCGASSYSLAQGDGNSAYTGSLAQGDGNIAYTGSLAQGYRNKAKTYSLAQGYGNSASSDSMAQGWNNYASGTSVALGSANEAYSGSLAVGRLNSASSYSFAQGSFNSAINGAVVFGKFNRYGDGDTSTGNSAALVIGDGTATSKRHDLMVVTKDGEVTLYSSTADNTGTGIMSSLRAISAAVTGGVTPATVSSIASAYAESAVSSVSGNYYSTSNPSGFITGVDLSPYQTTAGMSAYQPSGDYIYASSLGTGTI